jgi:hypothetical protein
MTLHCTPLFPTVNHSGTHYQVVGAKKPQLGAGGAKWGMYGGTGVLLEGQRRLSGSISRPGLPFG